MNTFTRNMKASLSTERKPRVRRQTWVLPFALSVVMIALTVSGASWMTVYCRSQRDHLMTRAARLDAELEVQRRILDNLRSRREKLCTLQNIRRNLAKFQLPLRERRPEQVTYLRRFHGGEVSARTASVRPPVFRTPEHARSYTYHSIR